MSDETHETPQSLPLPCNYCDGMVPPGCMACNWGQHRDTRGDTPESRAESPDSGPVLWADEVTVYPPEAWEAMWEAMKRRLDKMNRHLSGKQGEENA